jgi:hypothetical protein
LIKAMRGDGQTWAAIGRSLGLSRNTVIERGRRLRACAPVRVARPAMETEVSDDPNRPPLRAGHPLTWSLLTSEEFPVDGSVMTRVRQTKTAASARAVAP